jgi:hypothetical protein
MRLLINQRDLGKSEEGYGHGLEIGIDGLVGDPTGSSPSSIFIEYYQGKVQLHIWTDGKQDPQTIILT